MSSVSVLLGASALVTAFVTGVRAATERIPIRLAPWLAALGGLAWQAVFVLASLLITIALFTILYKMLPNTQVPILEALPGAVVAGVLYELLYGSIGAAIALLTWVYLSSLIMLFGAQFTALLHRDHLFNAPSRTGAFPSGQFAPASSDPPAAN
jgi:membrane protein